MSLRLTVYLLLLASTSAHHLLLYSLDLSRFASCQRSVLLIHLAQGYPDNIEEDQIRPDHGRDANGFGASPFEGNGTQDDIGDQTQDLGGDPACLEGILAKQIGKAQGTNQQDGVIDMGNNLDPLLLKLGRLHQHPDSPQAE